jgi:membrane protease YdiL (CAAX protease family)
VPTFNETPALANASANSFSPNDHTVKLTNQPDPNNPVWGVAGALLIWLLSIVLQAIIPVLVIIPFALHRGLNPSAPDFPRLALELAISDRTGILLQVISILPTHLLVLAVLWAFVTRFGKRPFLASFGWSWAGGSRWLERAVLIAGGVVLFLIATVLAKVLGAQKPTQLEQLINSSIAARYAIAVLAVFTAPFVEEFIYRGVLYSALQRTIGVNAAVVFVLALFTLIHVPQYWPNIGVISAIGMLSIVLTVVRAYSGRLFPCIIIHMSFNAVQALLLLIEPYLQRLVPTTEPAVPTASMLLPLIRLVF